MAQFVSSTKHIVGVSITPNIGVEVALMDKKSATVIKYGKRPLDYNLATREIQDYTAFKATIVDLFKELDISLKSSVYLVLPNVHLDFESLPLIIGDEAISNAILSKAEDSYIFKRVEPVSAWADLLTNTATDKRFIVYTSFQQTAVTQIKEIFTELGSTLVGIESSYPAILRGLWFSNAIGDGVDENTNWNLLLVNTNSYALFSLAGSRLVDYTEVPLAIKSFSYEEAYQAISTSVSQVLPNFPARKLMILSQADDICAEVLKTQIVFDEEIITHDSNKYSKEPPITLSPSVIENEAAAITYALIGALAVDHMEDEFLNLNLLGKTNTGGEAYFTFEFLEKEIVVTQELARKALLALAGGLALIFLIIFGLFALIESQVNKAAKDYEKKSKVIQDEILSMTNTGGIVDIESLVTKVININRKAISFYDSIATDIPQSVWLQYYYNKDGENLAIEGVSANIADIYSYYKSLKVISPQSSIKLKRLQILTEVSDGEFDLAAPDLGEKFYDFEISNIDSPRSKAAAQQENSVNDPNNPQGRINSRNRGQSSLQMQQRGSSMLKQRKTSDVPELTPPPARNLEPVDINN